MGRNLVLTESGRSVYRYADEIFSLGRDLCNELNGKPTGHDLRLEIGVADVLPGWIVYRLLEPVLPLSQSVKVICHDDKTERLMTRLVLNELDVVLSDVPVSPLIKGAAHTHLLGESGVSFLAAPRIACALSPPISEIVGPAPFILPMDGTALRRSFEIWCDQQQIRPTVHCEVSDCDLFEVFATGGAGIIVVPTIIEVRIRRQFKLHTLGRVDEIRERYFAISTERKISHPGVMAIANSARRNLFG